MYGPQALHADPRVTLLARIGHTHLGRVHVLPASTAQATATAAAAGSEAETTEAAADGARTASGSGPQAGPHSFRGAAHKRRALVVRGGSREGGLGDGGSIEGSVEEEQVTEPTACPGPVPSAALGASGSPTARHVGAAHHQGTCPLARVLACAVQLPGAVVATNGPASGHAGKAQATVEADQELARAASLLEERTARQAGSVPPHRPVSRPRSSSLHGVGEGLFAVSVLRSVGGLALSGCGSRGSLLGSGYSVSSRASSSSGGISGLWAVEAEGDSASDRGENLSRILQLLSISSAYPPRYAETPAGKSEVQEQMHAEGMAPEGGAAAAAASHAELELLSLQLPPLLHPGLLQLEAVAGHLVVACWHVAVLPTQQQVDELCALCAKLREAGMEQELEQLEGDLALVLRSCCPPAATPHPPPASPHTRGPGGCEVAGAGSESPDVRTGSVGNVGAVRPLGAVPDDGGVEPRLPSSGTVAPTGRCSEGAQACVHGHGSTCASLAPGSGPSGTECSKAGSVGSKAGGAGVEANGVSGHNSIRQDTRQLTDHGQQQQQQGGPPVPDAVLAVASRGLQDQPVALRAHTGAGPNPAAGRCWEQQRQEGLEVQAQVQAALGRLQDLLRRG